MDFRKVKSSMRNSNYNLLEALEEPLDLDVHKKNEIKNPIEKVKAIEGGPARSFRPQKISFIKGADSTISEAPNVREHDREDNETVMQMSQEEFDEEINLIHKYLSLDFKTSSFNSKILTDVLSKLGWFKILVSLQNVTSCHLLWLSRFGSQIDADRKFLNRFHIVNKIKNLDALIQPEAFNPRFTGFLEMFNKKMIEKNFVKEQEVIKNFYLDSYTIPNDLDEFQVVLEKYMKERDFKDTEFYWYYTKGKFKDKFEKMSKSELAPEFLSKSELFPCYIHRYPTKPLVVFGLH